MRSKSSLSGNPVDSRVASGMQFSLSNVYHELYELERFDRVGILIVPDDEKTERTPDTITVLFASSDKIECDMTLREVFEQSMDVAIRQLIVKADVENELKKKKGKSSAGGGGGGEDSERAALIESKDKERDDGKDLGTEDLKEIGGDVRMDVLGGPQPDEKFAPTKSLTRAEMLEKVLQVIMTVRDRKTGKSRQYATMDANHALGPMLVHVDKRLEEVHVMDGDIKEMNRVIDKSGVISSDGYFKFDDLLKLFDYMKHSSRLSNTFSEADIRNIAKAETSQTISRETFLNVYRESLERSMIAKKRPNMLMTGSFVSFVLQTVQVLAKGTYLYPMDFAKDGRCEALMRGATLGPERLADIKPREVNGPDE